MKNLISIIVTVYNVCNYLEECLDSIINQTYKLWECILVDDGSTDNSGEICDEYCKKDNRFHVIHKANGGPSSARNAGLEIIGDVGYGCFVDSDDCLDKHFLENAIGLIKKYDTDVVQVKYTRDYENLGSGEAANVDCMTADQVFDDILQFREYEPIVCAKLYRTQVIRELRFNESCVVLEDVEFLTKLMLSSSLVYSSYVGYYYRQTPNSLITQGLNIKKLIGSISSHNSCIETLKDTRMRERSYKFKFNSLFSWLIRTASYDDWKSYYKIVQKEVRSDFVQIIKNSQLGLKSKLILIACAMNPDISHLLIECRPNKTKA